MKKELALILCLVMLLGVFPMSAATAEGKAEKLPEADVSSVGEGEILYLTEGKNTATQQEAQTTESVAAVNFKSVNADRVENAMYIILDYAEIIGNDALLKKVKEMVASGKYVFIRANGREATRDDIYKLLEEEAVFNVEDSEFDALKAQYQTSGYIIHKDDYGMNVLRLQFSEDNSFQNFSVYEKGVDLSSGTLSKEARQMLITDLSKAESVSFIEEVEATKSYVSSRISNITVDADSPNSTPTDNIYTWPLRHDWERSIFRHNGVQYGVITRYLRGKEVYPSPDGPQYIFVLVHEMANGQYEGKITRNAQLEVKMLTCPSLSGISYHRMITENQPKTDMSGQTSVSMSFGVSQSSGVNAGVSWSTSFKDVEIAATLQKDSYLHLAQWSFKMQHLKEVGAGVTLQTAILIENQNGGSVGFESRMYPKWWYQGSNWLGIPTDEYVNTPYNGSLQRITYSGGASLVPGKDQFKTSFAGQYKTTSSLKLRYCPSKEAKTFITVAKNTQLKVVSASGDNSNENNWAKIEYTVNGGKMTLFASMQYLSKCDGGSNDTLAWAKPLYLSSTNYCLFKADNRIDTYKDNGSTGHIAAGDECYIYNIGPTYTRVNYPAGSSRITANIKTTDLIASTSCQGTFTANAKASTKAYTWLQKKNIGTTTGRGYPEKGDKIYRLCKTTTSSGEGKSYQYTLIIYTSKSGNRGYKLAWIRTSELNRITN
ncbi:MAG: hypothetical protein IKH21_05130 [Clostridia bacterium]|nr:hypothetical protein [Clostridia bacterium]